MNIFLHLDQWGQSKKRAGDERGLSRIPLAADPARRLPAFIPLVADLAPLTESLEQAILSTQKGSGNEHSSS